jgi:hypothetical protein
MIEVIVWAFCIRTGEVSSSTDRSVLSSLLSFTEPLNIQVSDARIRRVISVAPSLSQRLGSVGIPGSEGQTRGRDDDIPRRRSTLWRNASHEVSGSGDLIRWSLRR